jgi:DNA polymerase-3 subunit delta
MNNIYLLYGEEQYIMNEKINNIISKYIDSNVDNIATKYDLYETNISDVLEDASMPSLLSPIKIIICYNTFFLTSNSKKTDFEHNIDNLMKYINNPNPNTILILTANDDIDERKKIVKELKDKSEVYPCLKVNDYDLDNIVKQEFAKDGYEIDHNNIIYFLDKVGSNLTRIHNEISKLKMYKQNDKVINKEDILELVPKTVEENIFDLIDATVSNNKEKIFSIYNELINLGEEPIKIIVLLANQFRIIYQTKVLYKKGYTEKDIADILGIHPYRIKLAFQKGRSFDEKVLLNYLKELAELDIDIKTGNIDKNIGLELFFLKI